MASWACGIRECGENFESGEKLIVHQAIDHSSVECKVCGETLPAGFLAIQHAFNLHTRAEYVRAYDADADDIRVREQLKDRVEQQVDIESLVEQLESNGVQYSSGNA